MDNLEYKLAWEKLRERLSIRNLQKQDARTKLKPTTVALVVTQGYMRHFRG